MRDKASFFMSLPGSASLLGHDGNSLILEKNLSNFLLNQRGCNKFSFMSSCPPCSVAQDEKQALPENEKEAIALQLIILSCFRFLGDAGRLQGEKEDQAD